MPSSSYVKCKRSILSKYFAFVDLENAFDRVTREVVWWALRKVDVDQWIVRLVQCKKQG